MNAPDEIVTGLSDYIGDVFNGRDIDETLKNDITNACLAFYIYGELIGVCAASSIVNEPLLKYFEPEDESNSDGMKIFNDVKSHESELIEAFKKEF